MSGRTGLPATGLSGVGSPGLPLPHMAAVVVGNTWAAFVSFVCSNKTRTLFEASFPDTDGQPPSNSTMLKREREKEGEREVLESPGM